MAEEIIVSKTIHKAMRVCQNKLTHPHFIFEAFPFYLYNWIQPLNFLSLQTSCFCNVVN